MKPSISFPLTLIILISILSVSSFAQESAQLLFRSGWEADTVPFIDNSGDVDGFRGIDNSVDPPNNWNTDISSHPHISKFEFSYVCGDENMRFARIADDPTGAINPATGQINKVMHFWLRDTCKSGADTRVSTAIRSNFDNLDTRLTEAYQKVRVYFHPDLNIVRQDSHSNGWIQWQEFWIRLDQSDPPRWRISFYTPYDKSEDRFFWRVKAGTVNTGSSSDEWTVNNNDIEVPIGEWFTAETYYKMGGDNDGRIKLTIQRDGGPKQVVFDITDHTAHPDFPTTGLRHWNIQKLYVDPNLVDFVRNRGGVLQTYWDDMEVWTSEPPSGPVDTTPPTIPSGLSAAAISESQIDITWSASSDPESGVVGYKVFRDGVEVGSTGVSPRSFSDTGLVEGTSYSYTVKAVNGAGLLSSASIAVVRTTLPDTTRPTIVSISATGDANRVVVVFSEPVEVSSAQSLVNYVVSPARIVSGATLGSDLKSVTLTVQSLIEQITYSLTVNGVRDRANSPNTILANSQMTFNFVDVDPALVGWWMFDDGSGGAAVDSSGSGNDAILSAVQWSSDARVGTRSIDFNDVTDFVELGTNGMTTNSGTVALWVKPRTFNAKNYFFGHTQQGNSYADRIQMYSNNNQFGVGLGDLHGKATNLFAIPLNVWTHLALTWNEAEYGAYVNGNLMRSGTFASSTLAAIHPLADVGNNGQAVIGTDHRAQALDGLIDEVRIYNKALSSAEITSLANPAASSPKLNLISPAQNQEIVSSVVPVSYGTSGDLSEVAHAHLMLDSMMIIDTDFDGFAQFTNVANGDHTLHGWLVTSNHVEIEGSRHTVQFSTDDSDSNPPILNPLLTAGELLLSVDTDENAECRYSDIAGENYATMNSFTNSESTFHSTSIGIHVQGSYSYHIKCKDSFDNINTNEFEISFTVD